MKLSRALLERREITKKISRIKEEIQALLVTQEHERVSTESIENMMEQLNKEMEALKDLNVKIDRANSQHLLDKLNELRILDSKIEFYRTCRKILIEGSDSRKFYGIKEIKMYRNIQSESVNATLDSLEKERKEIDSQIQEINWTVEI